MAWTTPRTWAAGELVTASLLNTHVRDNFDFLAAAPHELWVSRSTDQTITDVTRTAISWNSEQRDVGFGFTPTASSITCQQTGIYTLSLTVQWSGSSSSFVGVDIDITGFGTGERAGNAGSGFTTNEGNQKNCAVTMRVQVNEVITANVFHNTTGGASQTIQASGGAGTNFRVVQVQRRLVS